MLKIRTGYSFRAAVGSLEEVMYRLKEIGAEYAPITDRASTFAWNKWFKLAKKNGLKPVFGVELAVSRDLNAKKQAIDYWVFLAKDDIQDINNLVYLATQQLYHEPVISYEQAMNAKGVFKIVGHRSDLDKIDPKTKDLFVELSPSCSKGYISKGVQLGFLFAETNDNKFPCKEDKALYEVICGRNASTQIYPQYILSSLEWLELYTNVCEPFFLYNASYNSDQILKQCEATLKDGSLLIPEKPKTLLELCVAGAAKLGVSLEDEVYYNRLHREIRVIYEKKFEDYFYIIADMMDWARQRMICGPGRGSSAGSLVCYLLGITSVDPIKHDLLFERFIDLTRADLPDIDLDFSDQKRDLIFKYLEEKYGVDRVARLGTVNLYRAQSALNEAGKVLNIPKWKTDVFADCLIDRPPGDPRSFMTIEDTLAMESCDKELIDKHPELKIAIRMEGHPRHAGQHAAGIIITELPVVEYVAIDAQTGATMCDKKDAEDLNLLKIDALGLTQLSVFEDTLSAIGKDINFLETIPLDDPNVFEVLNSHRFCGIFQFDGKTLRSICNKIQINDFEDLVSITSLARPGPMGSGGTQNWIDTKTGTRRPVYLHPVFEPFLKNTLGVITYQEQVMQICRHVGKMSWEDVTSVRRAIGKSMGRDVIKKYEEFFVKGAIENGVDEQVALKVFDDMCSYGAYGFNRSHAVAYSIVSYWCAYLKTYFPFEFAAATLTHEKIPEKQIKLLREIAKEGIDYIPVDKELSVDKWIAGEKEGKRVLLGPLYNVIGFGPKTVAQVMSSRARSEPLSTRADKLLSNPTTKIDSLCPIRDRFSVLLPNPSDRKITTLPTDIEKIEYIGDVDCMAFCIVNSIRIKNENDPEIVEKRGYEVSGQLFSMVIKIIDDSDEIYAKISRENFLTLGKEILDRGKPEKAMYAIKGKMLKDFRLMMVSGLRFIGYFE